MAEIWKGAPVAAALSEEIAAEAAALRQRGFDPGEIDGELGARTETALRHFQTVRGLEADGICGERSWTALLKG